MSVFYYAPGDLKSGFVGFRAVRSTGVGADNYKQEWFSLNDYPYRKARKLAYAKDAEFAILQAEDQVKRHTSTSPVKRYPRTRMFIATNLVFGVMQTKGYWRIAFAVYRGPKAAREFLITDNYEAAWGKALDCYVETWGLTIEDKIAFDNLLPSYSELLDYISNTVPIHKPNAPTDELIKKLEKSRPEKK